MNILDFQQKKMTKDKISMVTCYDYTSAMMLAETNIDCLLVGDSVAMVVHGYANTLAATIEMMCTHTQAVERGAGDKFVVSDLPFLSYRQSLSESVAAVQALMQAGAHAVKLEGAAGNLDLIKHLVASGVPVMGHLGLTPQFVHSFGGYRVQGKSDDDAALLRQSALALQDAGCFAVVLECVPAQLTESVSTQLRIPTIGIGAGIEADGQVLVYHDLLGLNQLFKPKFVKHYLNGCEQVQNAVNKYVAEIQSGEFPKHENSYLS